MGGKVVSNTSTKFKLFAARLKRSRDLFFCFEPTKHPHINLCLFLSHISNVVFLRIMDLFLSKTRKLIRIRNSSESEQYHLRCFFSLCEYYISYSTTYNALCVDL